MWSFETIFPSKKVSDHISMIYLTNGSSILSLSISFFVKITFKKALAPYFPSSELKIVFHLLLFSESRYFLIQEAFSDLLKDTTSIILSPPFG